MAASFLALSSVAGCAPRPPVPAHIARQHPECLRNDEEDALPDHCERNRSPNAVVFGTVAASVGLASTVTGWVFLVDDLSGGGPDVPGAPFVGAGLALLAVGVPLVIYGLRDENPYVDALEKERNKPGALPGPPHSP